MTKAPDSQGRGAKYKSAAAAPVSPGQAPLSGEEDTEVIVPSG